MHGYTDIASYIRHLIRVEIERTCKEITFNATFPFNMDIETAHKITAVSIGIKSLGLLDSLFRSIYTYYVNPDGVPILRKADTEKIEFGELLHLQGHRFIQIVETGEFKAILDDVRDRKYNYSLRPKYGEKVIPEKHIVEILGTPTLNKIIDEYQRKEKRKLRKQKRGLEKMKRKE